MITVFVKIKSVYGKELIYPACPITEIIAAIAKTKTLCDNDLKAIRKLGYEIAIKERTL